MQNVNNKASRYDSFVLLLNVATLFESIAFIKMASSFITQQFLAAYDKKFDTQTKTYYENLCAFFEIWDQFTLILLLENLKRNKSHNESKLLYF